jgi:hypothetical protein
VNDFRWLPALIIVFGFIFMMKGASAGFGVVRLVDFEERLRSSPQISEAVLAKAGPEFRAQIEASAARRAQMIAESSNERPMLFAAAVASAILGAIAVICGVGLRRERRWARTVWVGVSLVLLVAVAATVASDPEHWYRFTDEGGIALVSLIILVRRPRETSRAL